MNRIVGIHTVKKCLPLSLFLLLLVVSCARSGATPGATDTLAPETNNQLPSITETPSVTITPSTKETVTPNVAETSTSTPPISPSIVPSPTKTPNVIEGFDYSGEIWLYFAWSDSLHAPGYFRINFNNDFHKVVKKPDDCQSSLLNYMNHMNYIQPVVFCEYYSGLYFLNLATSKRKSFRIPTPNYIILGQSHDGTMIFYGVPDDENDSVEDFWNIQSWTLYTLDVASGLENVLVTGIGGWSTSPVISDDGNYLAFTKWSDAALDAE